MALKSEIAGRSQLDFSSIEKRLMLEGGSAGTRTMDAASGSLYSTYCYFTSIRISMLQSEPTGYIAFCNVAIAFTAYLLGQLCRVHLLRASRCIDASVRLSQFWPSNRFTRFFSQMDPLWNLPTILSVNVF